MNCSFVVINDFLFFKVLDDIYKKCPQSICDECVHQLKAAYSFIQLAQEVNKRIVDTMSKRTEANKESSCLQETQFDVQTCLEIKIEPEKMYQSVVEARNITKDQNVNEIELEEAPIVKNRNTNDS